MTNACLYLLSVCIQPAGDTLLVADSISIFVYICSVDNNSVDKNNSKNISEPNFYQSSLVSSRGPVVRVGREASE